MKHKADNAILDELARVFARAAVDALIEAAQSTTGIAQGGGRSRTKARTGTERKRAGGGGSI